MIPLLVNDQTAAPNNQAADAPVAQGDGDFATLFHLTVEEEPVLAADSSELDQRLSAEGTVTAADDSLVELVMAETDPVDRRPAADRAPVGEVLTKSAPIAATIEATTPKGKQPQLGEIDPPVDGKTQALEKSSATLAQTVLQGRMPSPAMEQKSGVNIRAGAAQLVERPNTSDETLPSPARPAVADQVAKPAPPLPAGAGNTSLATQAAVLPELSKDAGRPKTDRGRELTISEWRTTPATGVVPKPSVIAAPVIAPQPSDSGKSAKVQTTPDSVTEVLSSLVSGERSGTTQVQTSTAAPPTAGAETARQVATQIAMAVTGQPGRVTEIALNPEELGRVRLSMTAVDATITLNVLAERPETSDLLRRHIESLEQEFRAMGYDDISFTFGDDQQAQSDTDPDGDQHRVSTIKQDEVEQVPTTGKQQSQSGLDLRL